MKNKVVLGILLELLWFAVATVAAYAMVLPIKSEISAAFFQYLLISLFLVFTYFRFIAFMGHSILLENVWVKIGLLIVNIPLFFFVLNQYYDFIAVFDDYNFTLPANVFQHIHSGTEVEDVLYLKKLTAFCGIASMLVILLMEARIVYAIFKLRQLDKYLR